LDALRQRIKHGRRRTRSQKCLKKFGNVILGIVPAHWDMIKQEDHMPITEEAAKAIAKEVVEAIPAIRQFLSLPREDKVPVAKHILDAQIGSEETAVFKGVAGMTPEIVEMVSDPMLEMGAKALIGLLDGKE
jgi:hypothetical protein